jgi:hypothetical protein
MASEERETEARSDDDIVVSREDRAKRDERREGGVVRTVRGEQGRQVDDDIVDVRQPPSGLVGKNEPGGDVATEAPAPLLSEEQAGDFQGRWHSIQTWFVDHPRESVKDADTLVEEVMGRLAEEFSRVRSELESRWDRGDEVSTEDLRVALQRYRSLFQRLLTA